MENERDGTKLLLPFGGFIIGNHARVLPNATNR